MAVVEVACPSCKAMLKAPDNMAGKKARCKKCNASFRIPGANETGDGGDSQMLSVIDSPLPPPAASDNPFSFGDEPVDSPKAPPPQPKTPPPAPREKSTPKAKA